MLAIILTWVARDYIEVVITGALMTVAMAGFIAIPFLAEYFIDEPREKSE